MKKRCLRKNQDRSPSNLFVVRRDPAELSWTVSCRSEQPGRQIQCNLPSPMKIFIILIICLTSFQAFAKITEDSSSLNTEFRVWCSKEYEKKLKKDILKKLRFYKIRNLFNGKSPKLSKDLRYCLKRKSKINIILYPPATISFLGDSTRLIKIRADIPFHTGYLYIDNELVGQVYHDWIKIQKGIVPNYKDFVLNIGQQSLYKKDSSEINKYINDNVRFKTCDDYWFLSFFVINNEIKSISPDGSLFYKFPHYVY